MIKKICNDPENVVQEALEGFFLSDNDRYSEVVPGTRFIRTDCPANLTDEEVKWLRDNGYTTVVDLRGIPEHENRRCRLEDEEGFSYHHMPATIAPVMPGSADVMADVYVGMLDEQMDRIIDTIMNAGTGVIYFCSLGKDRTGVVSAIILHRLGFDDQLILDDYMATGPNLREFLEEWVSTRTEQSIHMHMPNPDYIRRVLSVLKKREADGTDGE